jgi:hypothetical protein
MAKPPPIVKIEAQSGKRRADYGQQLLEKLSADLNNDPTSMKRTAVSE